MWAEVRGSLILPWLFVSPVLGFDMLRVRLPRDHHSRSVSGFWPSVPFLHGRQHFSHSQHMRTVLLGDLDSLPPHTGMGYWQLWAIPHIFVVARPLHPTPPSGWSFHSITLSHPSVGGCTDASCTVGMFLPPPFHTPSSWPTTSHPIQPW